ncbi:CBL-interacting serine/threonine-protein kinase 23, partial [Mucuna pruriens]
MADAQASSSGNTENIIPIRVGRYELGQTLGTGTSSVVKLARHLDTGHDVAIKVFDKKLLLGDKILTLADKKKRRLRKQKKAAIKREIAILNMCRHPNVVRMIEVMATKKKIYIVLEHVASGELYDKISQTSLSGMTEGPARRYFQHLICGLDYCHSKGVSHRDLKPQNLLVDADGGLKVSDFGLSVLAQQVRQDGLLHTVCGTPHYTAPEVLSNNGYEGQKADIWSCGVILFFTVAGYLPFRTDADNSTVSYEKILRADFTCPYFFSKRLQSLVNRILDPNPATRITIDEIYQHEWFTRNYQPPRFSQEDISFDDASASSSKAPVRVKREARFISSSPTNEIISGIEQVANTLGFNVKRLCLVLSLTHQAHAFKFKNNNNNSYYASQMSIEGGEHAMRKGHLIIAIEIYEMAPSFHMVELRKAGGNVLEFHKLVFGMQFYKALSFGLQDIIWKAEPIDDAETDERMTKESLGSNGTIRVGKYELGNTLGAGKFSAVKLARHVDTRDNVAIKVFDKDRVLINQKIHAVMATKTKIYIVLELVTGGELFDRIASNGILSEPEARRYFQQLVTAVNYCHRRGIPHRNLKPEKLLVDANGVLKVSDFGLSALPQQVQQDGQHRAVRGSPQYMAPEVISDNGYYEGAQADIWSCGVILFVLLAGYLPFNENSYMNLCLKIFQANFTCPPSFSPRVKALIKRMLDPNLATRITISEIFQDEWFMTDYEQNVMGWKDAGPAAPEAPEAPLTRNAFENMCNSLGFNLVENFFKQETSFVSRRSANDLVSGIELAAASLGFEVKKRNYKLKIEGKHAGPKGHLSIATKIFEVDPFFNMVEIRKIGGDAQEFDTLKI